MNTKLTEREELILQFSSAGIFLAEEEEEEEEARTVVSLLDITERKRAEEETRQIKERLQLQVERMPIGLIFWDTGFRVLSWNPAAENIFGFTAQEALGNHPYDLIVPKEAQPHVDDIWGRLLEGDSTTAHSINDNITKDGRTIICQWSNTPLKEADGNVRGVLSMVQDITDRKREEEEVKKRAGELERFNRMAVGREMRMTELKQKINELSAQLGLEPPYALDFLNENKDILP